jgi:hypothetical protein
MATGVSFFQIQQDVQVHAPQRDVHINCERMADLINEEVMSILDTMFWRGVANPQSGELQDCNDQIYDLVL